MSLVFGGATWKVVERKGRKVVAECFSYGQAINMITDLQHNQNTGKDYDIVC